jgi:hypothetical protein
VSSRNPCIFPDSIRIFAVPPLAKRDYVSRNILIDEDLTRDKADIELDHGIVTTAHWQSQWHTDSLLQFIPGLRRLSEASADAVHDAPAPMRSRWLIIVALMSIIDAELLQVTPDFFQTFLVLQRDCVGMLVHPYSHFLETAPIKEIDISVGASGNHVAIGVAYQGPGEGIPDDAPIEHPLLQRIVSWPRAKNAVSESVPAL